MDRRVPAPAVPAIVGLAVLAVSLWQWGTDEDGLLRGISLGLVTGVFVWVVIRRRERRDAAIREELLQRRIEIARDLHDTVASKVAAIGLQAAAAARAMERDPAAARAALGHVEEAARGANADLRRMLEALRAPDDARPMAPDPGLADLPALIDDFRTAGLDATIAVDPSVSAIQADRAIGQVAYRIVQEALTNAVRHAAGARVDGEIRVVDRVLVVRVANSTGRASDVGAGPGFGLRGMRERVAVFGGALDAGPTPDGGFDVRARIPIDGAPAAPGAVEAAARRPT